MTGLRDVAVLLPAAARPFELAVYCEVFGVDRSGRGVPSFGFTFAAENPGAAVDVFGGLRITPAAGLDRLAGADLVAVAPPVRPVPEVSAAVADALRDVLRRGSRIIAVGSAAYVLAAAGLLDGRRVAADPLDADDLVRRFPRVRAVPGVRYVDDHPVYTAAGSTAAADLCLHVIRADHGPAVAERIARELVLAPGRSGYGDRLPGRAAPPAQRLLSPSRWRPVPSHRRACVPAAHRTRNVPPARG